MATKSLHKLVGESGAYVEVMETDGVIVSKTSDDVISVTASTLTVTKDGHNGKVLVLNRAAGVTVTLPAASGSGCRVVFVVGTTVTSNSDKIQVANASDTIAGFVLAADDTATPAPLVWVAGATADTITLNGSTTGGIKGDRLELIDVATNQWVVCGQLKQSGTEATPFSAAV